MIILFEDLNNRSVGPVGPVGPISPANPVAPVGPVEPYISVQNKQYIAIKGNETRSRYTNSVEKW